MRHRCRRNCGCGKPKTVVHPVNENVVHCCSEETVKHIHPSHTTVKNHHLVKNVHVFPHSTSVANTFNEVDVYGGSFNTGRPPTGVAGAMSPGYPGMGPGSQVAGVMSPGYPGMGPGSQVGGVMNYGPQSMGPGYGHHHKGMKKPNKWC